MADAQLQPSIEGTMQGGPLSPLLANILLDDFDKELESRGLRFVRYADDFLVFTKTRSLVSRICGFGLAPVAFPAGDIGLLQWFHTI
ncbi:MAG: reverse transcriptase domain-containing protein [Pirellulales bacterium]